ncbi:MAG: proline--tRNA ligase, partial [Clostridia bacterium]|nr:proline--tRNA ligase [Clostridia bacterium]
KDIENNQAVLVSRTTREKFFVSLDNIEEEVSKLLDKIQQEMFEAALKNREEKTSVATTYDEFKDIVENKGGFVKAMWCGDVACEEQVKNDTSATSRCMPFEQEQLSDRCVCCGKPAQKMVYWGKAY